MICTKCGHDNLAGSRFCSSCGAPIDEVRDDKTLNLDLSDIANGGADDAEAKPASGGLLVVTRGPNSGSRFEIEKVLTSVGRHPESDIFLDDITVSRRHVEIEHSGAGYLVRDVGSLNGTYLNRERIEEAPLTSHDELQVGTFRLLFLTGNDES